MFAQSRWHGGPASDPAIIARLVLLLCTVCRSSCFLPVPLAGKTTLAVTTSRTNPSSDVFIRGCTAETRLAHCSYQHHTAKRHRRRGALGSEKDIWSSRQGSHPPHINSNRHVGHFTWQDQQLQLLAGTRTSLVKEGQHYCSSNQRQGTNLLGSFTTPGFCSNHQNPRHSWSLARRPHLGMGVSASTTRASGACVRSTFATLKCVTAHDGYGTIGTSLGAGKEAFTGEEGPSVSGVEEAIQVSTSLTPTDVSESNSSTGNGPSVDKGHSSRDVEGLTYQILSLALPALVSLCVDPLMSAVDTAYIGRLGPELGGGEVGLGALGLNTYVFSFAFYVFGFLATVPTPFVASARARGDEAGAAKLVGQLLTLGLAFGTILTVALELWGPSVLHLMGSTPANEDQNFINLLVTVFGSPTAVQQALLFLRARALSAPAVLIMTVANGAFRGYLDTKTPLLIALGANAVNVILDPFLIFKLGMGVQGAAIATVAAEWTGAAAFLYVLSQKEPAIWLRGVSLPKISQEWEQTKSVLTSSTAVFGRTIALQAVFSTASAFAARAGPSSIAAHQVASQLWILLAFAADSLAVAAQGLIADRMGVGKLPEARVIAGRVLTISLGWGFSLLLAFQLLGGVLPQIFTSDKQVLNAVAPVITVIGLMQPITTYVYVGDGVLQGSQDFLYEALTMLISSSIGAGYIVSCGCFGADIDLLDVWVGLALMQGSRAVTFSARHWLDPRGPLAISVEELAGKGTGGAEDGEALEKKLDQQE